MKKKIIALSATMLSALVAGFCSFDVEAKTTDIVKNDTFVFDANNYSQGTKFNKNRNINTVDGVSLSMGKFNGTINGANNFQYGDYSFSNALLAASTTNTDPCYNITASKGTKVGIYYTLTSREVGENGYYNVSSDSTIEVVKENRFLFWSFYDVREVYTEKSSNMYYSEYTFTSKETVSLRAGDQYLWLFGLSVVTEEEISYRNEAEIAIDELANYYENNGATLNDEFKALVEKADAAINQVNHISKIENYDKYEEIVEEYNTLLNDYNNALNVALLISNLGNVEYTEEYKNQLALIEDALANVNNLDYVSNYDLYLEKKNEFDALSIDAINAFVAKVNEANSYKGQTESYVLINEAEELYAKLIESDKTSVAESADLLNEVKNAYTEMEENVTDNSFAFTYNEDGSVKKILFIGTINDFTCTSDLSKIFIYFTNEETGEQSEVQIFSVYTSLKVAGNMVKNSMDNVRYVYTKILNDDNQYSGVTFSMYYEVIYMDGHVITSNTSLIEVK